MRHVIHYDEHALNRIAGRLVLNDNIDQLCRESVVRRGGEFPEYLNFAYKHFQLFKVLPLIVSVQHDVLDGDFLLSHDYAAFKNYSEGTLALHRSYRVVPQQPFP